MAVLGHCHFSQTIYLFSGDAVVNDVDRATVCLDKSRSMVIFCYKIEQK